MPTKTKITQVDILVIGAGQSGLTLGYYLKKANKSFFIVDAHKKIGESWKKRYDSLRLFTPTAYCSLPGLRFTHTTTYPNKDHIAKYLEQYAQTHALPIQLDTPITQLKKPTHLFESRAHNEVIQSKIVVVATGPFQKPIIPFTQRLRDVFQIHSSEYKNSRQLPKGSVLVVGGGNSGAQIAVELSVTHDVTLATRSPLLFFSKQILGKDFVWWLDKLRLLHQPLDSWVGRKIIEKKNIIIGRQLKELLKQRVIKHKPHVTGLTNEQVVFANNTKGQYSTIIWATGFQPDYHWISIPYAIGKDGHPIHQKGNSHVRGLYFLGMDKQSRVSSGVFPGAAKDAEDIVHHLNAVLRGHIAPTSLKT